jgi:hypothetical protein
MTFPQTRALGAAILDDGIQSVNFFNGRLLSGEDLTREKVAQSKARQLLGRAVGDGVAYGLEVSEKPGVENRETRPVITVSRGLAVNRLGQPLALSDSVDVALTRPSSNGATSLTDGLFADCPKTFEPGRYVSGKGVYLLTIGFASGPDGGRVPVSGLGNIAATCNTRYQTEGVQFRLIQLPIDATDLSDEALLRNRVAYYCFGTQDTEVASFFANPFGPIVEKYGLLDDLRPSCLTNAEVPLAVIFWTSRGGIRFIDHWAVRRRITHPSADTDWPLLVADRRLAEAEAMFLQFQDQVQEMREKESGLTSLVASSRFDYLPPVGLLPVVGAGAVRGFSYPKFFEHQTYRGPFVIEGARLAALFRTALAYPPIDRNSREMLWLYTVRENQDTRTFPDPRVRFPYVVFSSGHIPYHGAARYDVSHFDYANYTLVTVLG